MSRHQFVHELESTADHIADASRADLQVLLRRAALLLRNVGGINLDPRTDDALTSLAAEMGAAKPDLVETIVGEWLVANSYLPVHAVDEESTVDGNG
ncbi:MAG: hypothetical protein EOS81_15925 [Mesorhizobium sp.]|uniref:hypothetical protein n=1 Tax=unclassified Mesorhizobium TaxID=325217 RepID=UPI000F7614EB|nr:MULTISPECIES: hypothetical protein [unclassified Mesorhizobium]RVC70964.1 hypothetical protein EN759_01805 [Mesorhizobium sp. M00.F.Ca.ET.038.03.1.1]RVC82212.1 hypothetical protein EN766_01515 [Mesorhizobium sp. M2A.F.Ca.ET.046.02.1.1]AZO36328.1 hypothetical protein EJ072_19305 [Mesorhizobium sp. M2A.F.Ca.ET.046.03.2.1]RWB39871.1 MAG: hypothetical protein EOQ44_26770 [Mesorhizobium sp.]RWE17012.1 MAG: hypothetical protein EOS76_19545 [Mesorhizobium sp.]